MADQTREHLENRARHPRIPVPHARRGDLVVDLPTEILARFLHALADPTRLRILEHLSRDGELHVSALVERLGQPQGRVSAHLTCLRTCGLVRVRQDGKYRYYALADQRIPALLALARDLARPNAAAIASCAIGTRHDPPEETER
ncbi:metalloregulator ArsR/SmtB family transcription factor [Thermomicrobium sp. 4228-Ro]|uniref:ArsR/SmtB family transcription factor n=1 Tax=Thermomicrobium sp. 4228-Ro TaxID=2993937 RepID=UPI00224880A1|nr:metalloregulator ArsR/SmtB family transcription factor [Thermomicrobium sp. 4228-Ro]MCX2726686.1 metalloregulator ArsR/SmtB family transcription factor [Thermomicrobium sp. 4228-Ro]